MCPDPQLLSVYFDGELPSPWKEKMQGHLAQCSQCRHRLESYSLFSCDAGDTAAEAAAQERVWKNIEGKTGSSIPEPVKPSIAGSSYNNRRPVRLALWDRRIAIPLPIAAAAALLLIAAAALLALRARDQQAMPGMSLATEEYSLWPSARDAGFDMPGMVQPTDLNGVLKYLGSGDSGDIVILRLPESRSFLSSGEPAIIRAADYSRRKP